jgi:putative endonuclease
VSQKTQALGRDGEQQAAEWYLAHGYDVLERNWRCRDGELDLVLRKNRTIVFCEVKTRTTAQFGTPAEAITHQKRQKLRHLAAKWLDESPVRPRQIRFDVAAILGGQLEIVEGCF